MSSYMYWEVNNKEIHIGKIKIKHSFMHLFTGEFIHNDITLIILARWLWSYIVKLTAIFKDKKVSTGKRIRRGKGGEEGLVEHWQS